MVLLEVAGQLEEWNKSFQGMMDLYVLLKSRPQREFTSVQLSRWYCLFFKMTKDIVSWPAECSFQKELVTRLHMLSALTIHYTTAHAQYSLLLAYRFMSKKSKSYFSLFYVLVAHLTN